LEVNVAAGKLRRVAGSALFMIRGFRRFTQITKWKALEAWDIRDLKKSALIREISG